MPWEPDMDTALRLAWWTAGVSFMVFLISLIGEIVGWWDLVGEIGMGLGATISILVTVIAVFAGAGRQQVDAVGSDVRSVGEDVRTVGEDVRTVGDGVRDVHAAVLSNGERLEKLDKLDKLDELDVIQAELDAQTGVLGRQLAVLGEIRDGI